MTLILNKLYSFFSPGRRHVRLASLPLRQAEAMASARDCPQLCYHWSFTAWQPPGQQH